MNDAALTDDEPLINWDRRGEYTTRYKIQEERRCHVVYEGPNGCGEL